MASLHVAAAFGAFLVWIAVAASASQSTDARPDQVSAAVNPNKRNQFRMLDEQSTGVGPARHDVDDARRKPRLFQDLREAKRREKEMGPRARRA